MAGSLDSTVMAAIMDDTFLPRRESQPNIAKRAGARLKRDFLIQFGLLKDLASSAREISPEDLKSAPTRAASLAKDPYAWYAAANLASGFALRYLLMDEVQGSAGDFVQDTSRLWGSSAAATIFITNQMLSIPSRAIGWANHQMFLARKGVKDESLLYSEVAVQDAATDAALSPIKYAVTGLALIAGASPLAATYSRQVVAMPQTLYNRNLYYRLREDHFKAAEERTKVPENYQGTAEEAWEQALRAGRLHNRAQYDARVKEYLDKLPQRTWSPPISVVPGGNAAEDLEEMMHAEEAYRRAGISTEKLYPKGEVSVADPKAAEAYRSLVINTILHQRELGHMYEVGKLPGLQ